VQGEVSAVQGEVSAVQGEVSAVQGEVSALRRELDQTQHEVSELKAATEIAPAPPLPKTRPGSLDDLREQLRAAHREADETTEE
jgi:chromosome segregation ATPase